MPELPEVETIRRDLQDRILDKKIEDVEIHKESAYKDEKNNFFELIQGNKFADIDRAGKLLSFDIRGADYHILCHLRMTGKLIYQKPQGNITEFPTDHTGVIFYFSDKSELYFDDVRTFGYMQVVDTNQKNQILNDKLGIEPFQNSFTLENFTQILKNRSTDIKSILMKQKAIAGIGNIYADEICFESGIRPNRKIPNLRPQEVEKIYHNCEDVLQEAIDHRGTTFRSYVDSSGEGGNFAKKLKVYNREEEPCYSCNNQIRKIKHKGRGTHFCPGCQN